MRNQEWELPTENLQVAIIFNDFFRSEAAGSCAELIVSEETLLSRAIEIAVYIMYLCVYSIRVCPEASNEINNLKCAYVYLVLDLVILKIHQQ